MYLFEIFDNSASRQNKSSKSYFYFFTFQVLKKWVLFYFYLSNFFGRYFYFYLSNFLASYLYFYLSTQTRYLLQHCRLDEVFARLRGAKLKLKPSKCSLFQRSVEFLGHVVSEAGIAMQDKKISAIRDWFSCRNVTEVRPSWDSAAIIADSSETFPSSLPRSTDLCRKEQSSYGLMNAKKRLTS